LPENNVGNTHYFISIITVSPTASRIKETKDAYARTCNMLQYLTYLLPNITSIPALKCEVTVRDLKQLKLQT